MKKGSTHFLRATLVIITLGVLAICIFALPQGLQFDGEINYGPIIIGLYIAAIPFFFALWQSWKLLALIDRNTAFSLGAVNALNKIKYCAISISGLFVIGMPYIFIVADKDDAPGAVAIGLIIVGASLVIATFAAVLAKLLKNVIDIKSENELTV